MGEITFLKKPQGEKALSAELAEAAKANKPIYDKKNKVWFVNGVKYKRAQTVLDLIRGEKAAIKADDISRKEHYSRQLQVQEVDPKDDVALPVLYEIMGGLIRTNEEQKNAEKEAEEARAKGKKRMIE